MKKILLVFILSICLPLRISAMDTSQLDEALNQAAKFVYQAVQSPQIDSIGGEWAVIGLVRSGYDIPESWYEDYYEMVSEFINENNGILHDKKYTEYSRVILGLTAAGYDPRNIAGHDLTKPLDDFEKTIWQGINGPIFALLALDSQNYPSSLRGKYIDEILSRQLPDGGWNLTAGADGNIGPNNRADADITGMALQALAKYQTRNDIKIAIDKALDCLSAMQDQDGGFGSWGVTNSESVAQVIVALCELGIDIDDSRFVKNGNSLFDNIMTLRNDDGSFKHTPDGTGNSQMSTEQALYALAAAQRASVGKNSLYRMEDAVKRLQTIEQSEAKSGLPNKHEDVMIMPIIAPYQTFADIIGHDSQTAITWLAQRGIISGKNPSTFDPNTTMTRAEYAAIITRGLGLEAKPVSIFTDVRTVDWYAGFVGTAYSYGIVTGTSTDTFNPNGTITRQEAAVMTARAAQLCGIDINMDDTAVRNVLAQFGDYITVAQWAKASMAFCYNTGILSDEEFEIQPTVAVKRYEVAQMLYNMLEKAKLNN